MELGSWGAGYSSSRKVRLSGCKVCVPLTASSQWLHQGLSQLSSSVTVFWGWRLSDWTRQWYRDWLFPPTVQSLYQLVVALDLSAGHHQVSIAVWGLPLAHFCLRALPFPSLYFHFSGNPITPREMCFKAPKKHEGRKGKGSRLEWKWNWPLMRWTRTKAI